LTSLIVNSTLYASKCTHTELLTSPISAAGCERVNLSTILHNHQKYYAYQINRPRCSIAEDPIQLIKYYQSEAIHGKKAY